MCPSHQARRPVPLCVTLLAASLLISCQAAPEKRADAQGDPHQGLDLPAGHPAIALPGDNTGAAKQVASGHPPVFGLDGDGLRLIDPKSGASRPLAFGVGETQLQRVTEKLKGPAKAGRNTECGAGPLAYLSWQDGLTLYSLDGLFAGWALTDQGTIPVSPQASTKGQGTKDMISARLTTVSGIGIGSTRTQLLDAYDARIEQTSLGTEFNAAGLSGLLDGTGPKAKVTNLWSGLNCSFR